MKDNVKLGICFLIFSGFAMCRIYLAEFQSSIAILIMAIVNSTALISVVGIIIADSYIKLNDRHEKIATKNNIKPSINNDIKRYYIISSIIFIVIIIMLYLYINKYRSEINNDIMSIGTLIMSMQSNTFVRKIVSKTYKSFY